LYPAYRSFPESFANDHTRLYVPWSLKDAVKKLEKLLYLQSPRMGQISAWTDGTVDRIVDILEGQGDAWLRMTTDYRRHTHESKFNQNLKETI
jgi:hypothetical protein